MLHSCKRNFPLCSYFSASVKDNRKVLRRTESHSPRRDFVEEKLGSKYVIGRSLDFAVSFEESSPATPMFFILSPGVDPLKDVEKHGNACLFQLSRPLNCTRLLWRACARWRYPVHSHRRGNVPHSDHRFFQSQVWAHLHFHFGSCRTGLWPATRAAVVSQTHAFVSLPLSATAADAQQALGRLKDYSKGHEYMRTLHWCVWGLRGKVNVIGFGLRLGHALNNLWVWTDLRSTRDHRHRDSFNPFLSRLILWRQTPGGSSSSNPPNTPATGGHKATKAKGSHLHTYTDQTV